MPTHNNDHIRLAIVIPAYKSQYIRRTLDSIFGQTDTRFNMYMGIDGPIPEFGLILEEYGHQPNLTVCRFDKNLGTTDLVAQWERCIALTNNEEYIWLFPDDDVMSEDCVRWFYEYIGDVPSTFPLLRFHTRRIDEAANMLTEPQALPETETGDEFILARILKGRLSSVAEYIFSRKVYEQTGGFVNLPAAWGSDDATWYKFAKNEVIRTIPQGMVYTRQGNMNISNSPETFRTEKLNAIYLQYEFLSVNHFFEKNIEKIRQEKSLYRFKKDWIFFFLSLYNYRFGIIELFIYAYKNNRILNDGYIKNLYRLWLYDYRWYKRGLQHNFLLKRR